MIRLLIADDEALERETLADIVARRFEHEVTIETAENGRKAADTAVLWGADLILMDIEMPGMNGLDAARAVLEQRPECKVIFVTAYSLFQYAHEAMHLGACDYLLKPVNPDEVEASIRKAIRQIEAGRRLAELAPVEPEPEADPESDAAEAGENDRNALVMAHVRKYMEDNYMFDLSLDSVSEILHISPAYLSAQFKKYQKMNFLDCLTELRINAAKELLTDPFRSAAEVASMVGYEDSSYFARTFKKRTGMTPTQYRKEAAKAAREARLCPAVSCCVCLRQPRRWQLQAARRSPRRVATACAALGALTGCTAPEPTAAEPQPELILRYAENQPEDYPTTQAALAFADLVAQRTDGRVKVLVYSGGELGAEQSVIQQMQFGGIDFSRVSLSQLAEYEPALSVLQLPYLYTDADQMWRVLDGTIGDEFLSTLESLELTGLSWFDAGVRSIYTRQKVTGLADLQGLTIRVQESDMMSEMITDLGATPVKVVYSKVYAALHNGEIDGAENNWPSYEAMGHYEVAPYFLKDEHTRVPEVQLASPAVMEKLAALDERYPEIIRLCARESAKVERRLWAQQEAESESDLRAAGIEVTELDEEEKARFRAAVQPMYDRFAQQGELIARIRQA